MEQNFDHIIDNLRNTKIGASITHGNGLFATSEMEEGFCLGTLDGQLVSWSLYEQMSEEMSSERFHEAFFMEWNAIEQDTLLVRPFRSKYSFINHSRNPNLFLMQEPLRVVTLRPIAQGEELFLDYRKEALNDDYLQGHGKTYL